MKQKLLGLILTGLIALTTTTFAQVTSAEVQGVETTAAKSAEGADVLDESVGEVQVLVIAMDADGNPVEGAAVSWTVQNNGSEPVYVLHTSGMMDMMENVVAAEAELVVDGGMTNENGEAYITVDSGAAGDSKVFVMVDDVEGKTYRGKDMRVVWF